ncbi:MAG: hypothetical protein ABI082_15135 [Dokdonella sp.]
MSRDKTLALIGVSDQEAAHLRLIMRRAASVLDQHWVWGEESSADLLVIDARSFAGQMARTRAQGAGVRYAIFSDKPLDDDVLVLRRPLQLVDVIALLNSVGGAVEHHPEVESNNAGFYVRDIGDDAGEENQASLGATFDRAPAVQGLDELLRAQPVELRSAPDWAQAQEAAELAGPAALTAAPGDAVPDIQAATPRKYATRGAMLADTMPHGLRAYLEGDLLGGPARYALPGKVPPLVLDPKLKLAHSPLGLAALQPYCHQRWRLCDWQALTGAELDEVRATQPALPYTRLVWLDVLVHSDGRLASHLDPGGTYRLARWVEIDHDLSRYFRVASSMLQPMRLHEIAAASGAPMGDVFDVINAYEAVGLIEWQPRARREEGPRPPSFLDKLRNPFGKA